MTTKAKVKPEIVTPRGNGMLRKNVRFFMTDALWGQLVKRADEEGRREGRPKSVAKVMREVLEKGVTK